MMRKTDTMFYQDIARKGLSNKKYQKMTTQCDKVVYGYFLKGKIDNFRCLRIVNYLKKRTRR